MSTQHPSRITGILGTYLLSSEQEKEDGASWYERAGKLCTELGLAYHKPKHVVAGVLAALSPNNRWERNCLDTENMLRAWQAGGLHHSEAVKVATFNANKWKALHILESGLVIDHIGKGRKVTAFYHCIMGQRSWVCVDGHAYSIWLGARVSTNKVPKISDSLYDQIEQDYISCAARIAELTGDVLTPPQLQAVTWLTHRRLYAGRRG